MDVLNSILTGLTGGLLGPVLTTVLGMFQKKQEAQIEDKAAQRKLQVDAQKHKFDLELRQVDLSIAQAEATASHNEALVELQSAREDRETKEFVSSQESEAALSNVSLPGWVNSIRALNRPALTWWAMLGACFVTFIGWRTGNTDLLWRAADSMLTLAVMSYTWWFGQRGINAVLNREKQLPKKARTIDGR